MKEEIMKILKMVEEGKIKAEDAYKLIDAIEEVEKSQKKEGKFLKIHVEEEDGEKVKISIPINLVKLIDKFIPKEAKEKIEEHGFNLNDLVSIIQEGVSEPIVDVEGEDGEKVKIWIE
jgi:hypothetical protein